MRMITATTAFKMPLYGVSFPLSAWQESSTVFQGTKSLHLENQKKSGFDDRKDFGRVEASLYYK